MKTRRPRTMRRMTAEADAMRESDRLFFERFPHRQHRVRRLIRIVTESDFRDLIAV